MVSSNNTAPLLFKMSCSCKCRWDWKIVPQIKLLMNQPLFPETVHCAQAQGSINWTLSFPTLKICSLCLPRCSQHLSSVLTWKILLAFKVIISLTPSCQKEKSPKWNPADQWGGTPAMERIPLWRWNNERDTSRLELRGIFVMQASSDDLFRWPEYFTSDSDLRNRLQTEFQYRGCKLQY